MYKIPFLHINIATSAESSASILHLINRVNKDTHLCFCSDTNRPNSKASRFMSLILLIACVNDNEFETSTMTYFLYLIMQVWNCFQKYAYRPLSTGHVCEHTYSILVGIITTDSINSPDSRN